MNSYIFTVYYFGMEFNNALPLFSNFVSCLMLLL